MKICPTCNQTYIDDMLNYCLNDGAVLVSKSGNQTVEMRASGQPTGYDSPGRDTDFKLNGSEQTFVNPNRRGRSTNVLLVFLILGVLFFVCGGGGFGLYLLLSSQNLYSQNSSPEIYAQNANTVQNKDQKSDTTVAENDESDSKGLTIEKFMRVEPGSSYKKAVEILGSEGEQLSSSGSGSYKAETYKWSDDDSVMIIMVFINDKLSSKSQSGLGDKINESLTLEKFEQVKDGMRYEEVSAILGEGALQNSMTIMNTTIETYQWKADEFSYVSLSFQNGKVNSKTQFGLK